MTFRASDCVTMLDQIERVNKSTLLTDIQRQIILQDMTHDLPLEMFSITFKGSREIVKSILEELQNVGTSESKESTNKSTTESKSLPPKSTKKISPKRDDANPRGKSTKAKMGKRA